MKQKQVPVGNTPRDTAAARSQHQLEFPYHVHGYCKGAASRLTLWDTLRSCRETAKLNLLWLSRPQSDVRVGPTRLNKAIAETQEAKSDTDSWSYQDKRYTIQTGSTRRIRFRQQIDYKSEDGDAKWRQTFQMCQSLMEQATTKCERPRSR